MRVKALLASSLLGTLVLAAPAVDARPTPSKTLTKSRTAKTNPTGLGPRTGGLKYAVVPPGSFAPVAWTGDLEQSRFTLGLAPLTLPDGARIREVSCFGDWDSANNTGEGVRLRRRGLASGSEVLAMAEVFGGTGVRRLDATVDHVVDNFANAYQLEVVFNTKPAIRGCRIGFEPA
jgi:hypothetical protein